MFGGQGLKLDLLLSADVTIDQRAHGCVFVTVVNTVLSFYIIHHQLLP